MILTVGNTKGGVGKSTLAINIAASLARAGREVMVIDGDRQGSAQLALSIRAESGIAPAIACSAAVEASALRALVKQMRSKFDDIIIDCGGRDSEALRGAMIVTDILLVPFQPRAFDVWAMTDMVSLVTNARELRDGLVAYAVINEAEPNVMSADNRDAVDAVKALEVFEYMDAPIGSRKAFVNAAGVGRSVDEYKPLDAKASHELAALVKRLVNKSS